MAGIVPQSHLISVDGVLSRGDTHVVSAVSGGWYVGGDLFLGLDLTGGLMKGKVSLREREKGRRRELVSDHDDTAPAAIVSPSESEHEVVPELGWDEDPFWPGRLGHVVGENGEYFAWGLVLAMRHLCLLALCLGSAMPYVRHLVSLLLVGKRYLGVL